MIRSFLKKRKKIFDGVVRTFAGRGARPYAPEAWWDDAFYGAEISDARTISRNKSQVASMYHYASVEMLILRHLANHGVDLDGASVLDLGSGAGHWISFFRELRAQRCTGVDVSHKSVEFLEAAYASDDSVEIRQGLIYEAIAGLDDCFDAVCAIGVMFHIVDDDAWRRTLAEVTRVLRLGGALFVGGHFGWIDGLDVQVDPEGHVNKRLRSRRTWTRELKKLGFRDIRFYHNAAYLHVSDALPENNLLVATR